MQRYTIFFVIVNAVHVSGGFCVHHQEFKNCTQYRVYAKLGIYSMPCTVFELLMMGGETARHV
jgi:hypothetical protein